MITFQKGRLIKKKSFPYRTWLSSFWMVECNGICVGFKEWEHAIIYEKLLEMYLTQEERDLHEQMMRHNILINYHKRVRDELSKCLIKLLKREVTQSGAISVGRIIRNVQKKLGLDKVE